MNVKHPLIPTIILGLCLAGYVYFQSQNNDKRIEYLTEQMDVLQDQVAGLKAQTTEMNDNLKWMRDRWYNN